MSGFDNVGKQQRSSSSTEADKKNVLPEPLPLLAINDESKINALAANKSKENLSLHFQRDYRELQAREVALKKPLLDSVYDKAYHRLRQTHYAINDKLSDEKNRQRQVFRCVMDDDVKQAQSYKLTLGDFFLIRGIDNHALITRVVMSKRQSLLDDIYEQVVLPYYQDAKDTKRMDVTKQGVYDSRLLYWAAICNQSPDHLEALISQEALVINAVTTNGKTALYVAAQCGHLPVVQALKNQGAAVNQAMKHGFTPLYIAAHNGHLLVVQALLSWDTAVNPALEDGMTPLFIAAWNDHISVVLALLNRGATVNQARYDGATPLFVAAQEGHLSVVLALLSWGAAVNQARPNGATPLSIATHNGHKAIVCFLKTFNKVIEFCQARSVFSGILRTFNTLDLLFLYKQNSAAFLLGCLHLFDAVNKPETYPDSRLKLLLTLFIKSPTLEQMKAFVDLKNNLTHSTPSSGNVGSAEEKKGEHNANQLALNQPVAPVFIRFLQQQNPEGLTHIGKHMNSDVLKSQDDRDDSVTSCYLPVGH